MMRASHPRLSLVVFLVWASLLADPETLSGRGSEAVAHVVTAGGLHTVHLETEDVSVVVHFPEDLVSGEQISGRVTVALKGDSERQRAQAIRHLNRLILDVGGVDLPLETTPWQATVCEDVRCGSRSDLAPLAIPVRLHHRKGALLTEAWVPLTPSGEDAVTGGYRYRPVGITGRPLEIRGAFDGDSATTRVFFARRRADVIAESPRHVLAEIPAEAVGAGLLELRERARTHSGSFRGLQVALQPGKPALHQGERTTLSLRILGLEDLDAEMPVQLVSRDPGRVILEAGAVQTLHIHPSELQAGGVYQWIGTLQGAGGGPVDVAVSTHHSRPEQPLIPRSPSGP